MTGSPAEAGVVRLAVQDIFHRIRSQSTNAVAANTTPTNDNIKGTREYLVRVSYLEIYNEQIYDLLAQPSPSPSKFKSSLQHHHLPPSTSVRIFESRTEGVVVRGLREEIVTCPEDVFALLDAGDARRRVGSTGMNRTSSRSHSVFRLVLESRSSSSKGGGGGPGAGGGGGGIPSLAPSSNSSVNSDSDSVATGRSGGTQHSHGGASVRGPVRISSLSLVDLAGSESVKNTGSTGVRQKEGQYINKSLLTLGHVVHKLSEMSSREKGGGGGSLSSSLSMMAPNEHIPYRDSKLTRLLQPSLGGNAQVCIICNISPALSNLEESHNTLKFAMRAKKIKQHARITEVTDEKTLLRSYREEIEELKRQLREAMRTSADAQHSQQHHRRQGRADQTTSVAVDYSSSSDEEDHDDTHVLVSAISNLESLILKAGAKSSRKATTVRSNSSIATTSDEGNDESSLPSRALDAALMRVESVVAPYAKPESSSPAVASDSYAASKSVMTPATAQRVEDDDEDDHHLLEELHRIQDMLGVVMKKKRKGGGGGVKLTPGGGNGKNVNNPETRTPEWDAEVERLRMQLQEQEVATTMRKADSSFLQGQLNLKDG